jgi:putative drug exporter of the RND superfamily
MHRPHLERPADDTLTTLESWTAGVLRLRVLVLVCWLVVLAVGAAAAVDLPTRLSNSFSVPGTESERARVLLAGAFDERPDGTFTAVFRVHRRLGRSERARVVRRLERAAAVLPAGKAGELQPGGGIVYADLSTPLSMQQAKRFTPAVRAALRARDGPRAYLTGQPAIQHDLDPILAADLRHGAPIAAALALLVLLAVLGPTAALALPFALAAATGAATLIAVDLLARVVPMVSYVGNVVELIGLGLAIDYSLLVVCRFREELRRGLPVEQAVLRTTASAGRAVAFSGLAVSIGLALLALMPVPFVRSLGLAAMLVPLAAVAAALTLQPVLLALLGTRAFAPVGFLERVPRPSTAWGDRFWPRLSGAVMRRPVLFLLVGTLVLLAAAAPALRLQLTPASLDTLPAAPESLRGYGLLAHGIGAGAVTPTSVVIDAGPGRRANRGPVYTADQRLADALVHDPEVRVVASGPAPPYSARSGRYTRVIVVGKHSYGAEASRRFVSRLRDRLIPAARFPAGAQVAVGGGPAQGADFLSRTYSAFPWFALATLALAYLVLVRAFRSVLLPLKAVLLSLLSVAAACGMVVAVFRYGVGADLLGVRRGSQLEGWVPIVLFATLFGLSMDYQVFMVTRMREAWDEGATNEQAVARGLQQSGRIVTAAALVMAIAFFGFVGGRIPGLQQFGLGLGLAVLLDATVIRMLLVPSAMALLGRYNWWLPRPLAWLVRIDPSPPAHAQTP